MTAKEKLIKIQNELKVPKTRTAKHYKYRSFEDILDAVKPLLREYNVLLTIVDDIVLIGARYYVKSTCYFASGDDVIKSTAFAREEEKVPTMSEAQITSSTSSYARKCSLEGLFLLDDSNEIEKIEGVPTKNELSYQEIKDKLLTLNTKEDIDTYSKEIKKSFGGVDEKKREAIAGAFRIRRAEIDNS